MVVSPGHGEQIAYKAHTPALLLYRSAWARWGEGLSTEKQALSHRNGLSSAQAVLRMHDVLVRAPQVGRPHGI
jgi:hypothetical protein